MEERIIEFVRENKMLYDKSNKSYKNVWLRDKKFEELSEKLNTPAKQLKDRWRTLRDKYNRAKKRQPSGSGASSPKKWKWKDAMSFLDDVDSENMNTTCNFEEIEIEDFSSFLVEDAMEPSSVTETLDSEPSIPKSSGKKKRSYKETGFALDSAVSEMNAVSDLAKHMLTDKNEDTSSTKSFFDSLCKKVEKMDLNEIESSQLEIELLGTILKFQEKRQQKN